MYQVQFYATDSAGWAQAVELIDTNTNLPLAGIDDATFELEVDDRDGCRRLTASSGAGTIIRPEANIVQWVFEPRQMKGLCTRTTYRVGLTMTTEGGTIQLLVGSLAFVTGVVSQ